MKFIKYKLICILLGIQAIGYSQNIADACANGSSTDWNNPVNNSDYNSGGEFTNSFNWFEKSSSGYLLNINTNYDYQMKPIYNLDYAEHYRYLKNIISISGNPDPSSFPLPENGWELLAMNTGFYPDGTIYTSNIGKPEVPFIVLYNKYEEKIRLFATNRSFADNPMNVLNVTMSTNNASILRLNNGFDTPISEDNWIERSHALAVPPSTKDQWFSVDFPVTFDPCVCDYPSGLNFEFNYVKKEDLHFTGGSIEGSKKIVDANELVTQDWLGNFNKDNYDNANGGFRIYNDLNDMLETYIKELEYYNTKLEEVNEHNKKVKRNLAILKVAKTITLSGFSDLFNLITPALKQEMKDFASDIPQIKSDDESLKKYAADIKKETTKILGKQFDSYGSRNFSLKTPPKAPIQTSVNYSEHNFSGKLSMESQPSNFSVITPGSQNFDAMHPSNIPIYNEPMGVFALIDKPEISFTSYGIKRTQEHAFFLTYPCGGRLSNGYCGVPRPHQTEDQRTYQLNLSNLSYLINQSLDVKNKNIQFALIIEADVQKDQSNSLSNSIHYFVNKSNNIESVEDLIDTKGDNFDLPKGMSRIRIETDFMNAETLESEVIYWTLARTNVYKKHKADGGLGNLDLKNLKIQLKALVDIEYQTIKADGSKNEYTYTRTYNVDISANTITKPFIDLESINNPTDNIVLDYYLASGEGYDISSLNSSFNHLCSGKEITIKHDFINDFWGTDNEQHGVLVTATEKIIFEPGSKVSEKSKFTIINNNFEELIPKINSKNPNKGVSQSKLDAICQTKNTHYIANPRSYEVTEDNTTLNSSDQLDFKLFPNPATSTVNLNINSESDNIFISITNVNGQMVKQLEINEGKTNSNIDLDIKNLERGIYMVNIQSNEINKTEKLVIK